MSIKSLTQNYEEQIRKAGFVCVCGVDEVGRGAWAGPIVAAGVIFEKDAHIHGLNDSKKLTPDKRKELDQEIREKAKKFYIAELSVGEIDSMGVGKANELVIKNVIRDLSPDFALIDKAWVYNLNIPHELIIKGDSKVFSIAAASIIAKVYRDDLMNQIHQEFPKYNFGENKGYGTADHQKALATHGHCIHHRISFQPISQGKLLFSN